MGKSVSAPTIDAGPAIEQFHKAADVIQEQYPTAFNSYRSYVDQGTQAALRGFGQSVQQNLPFSQSAADAANELRSFMGMTPISKTAGLSSRVENLMERMQASPAGRFGYFEQGANQLRGLQNDLQAYESATDPTQRGQIAARIQDNLGYINKSLEYGQRVWDNQADALALQLNQGQLQQGAGRSKQGIDQYDWRNMAPEQWAQTQAGAARDVDWGDDPRNPLFDMDAASKASTEWLVENTGQAQAQRGQLEDASKFILNDLRNEIGAIGQQFGEGYTETPERALTGQEIQSKLEDLPEYQFQFNQGTKALERSQAARGVLQSGNALLEAQDFGQNLAQNIYGGHLQRLAGFAGMNMPQVNQGIGLTTGAGQFSAGAANSLGQQSQGYLQGIANARQSAFNQSGQTMYDAAKTNAQMQMQASLANQQAGMQGLGMGMKLLGGLF